MLINMSKYNKRRGSDEGSDSEQDHRSGSKRYNRGSDSEEPKGRGYRRSYESNEGSSGEESYPQKRQRAPEGRGGQKSSDEAEVFVGGLSWEADESDLQKFFRDSGSIVNVKILKNDQGKSRGIAFVKFGSSEEASEAIKLNGQEHMGRTLRINLSSDKPQKDSRTSSGPSSSTNTVFVGNLPYNADEQLLSDFFQECGAIKQVRIAHDQDGNKRGFAHVEFESTDAADAAVKHNGKDLDGRELKIDFAGEKRSGGGRDGGSRGGRGGRGGGRGRPRRN